MPLFQYNCAGLFVGGNSVNSPAFEEIATHTLEGVQTVQFAAVWPRENIQSWDGAGDQELIQRPRAELSFTALFGSGTNERNLGFSFGPTGSIAALSSLNEERNYYLLARQDHNDAIGGPEAWATNRLFSMGNGVVTHYAFAAQVGQPSTINVTVEGLSLLVQPSGTGQPLPSVHKQTGSAVTGRFTLPLPAQTVLDYFSAAPGSINLTFNTGSAMGVLLSGQNACPIESFGFSIEMPRTEVKDLGWAYPNQRPIQWPVVINIRADARLNEFQLDTINRYGCPDSGYTFSVGFDTNCTVTGDFTFQFNGAKLASETVGLSVGGGPTNASFSWSLMIDDINRASPNFYINATGTPYDSVIFDQVDYATDLGPLTFELGTSCFLSILSGPAILSGNSVFVTDEPGTVVVRAAQTDYSDTQDITVTIS